LSLIPKIPIFGKGSDKSGVINLITNKLSDLISRLVYFSSLKEVVVDPYVVFSCSTTSNFIDVNDPEILPKK